MYTQTFFKKHLYQIDNFVRKQTNKNEAKMIDPPVITNVQWEEFSLHLLVFFFFLFFLRFCGCRCVCVCFFVYVHYSGPSNYPNIQLCHYPARLLISLSLLNKNPWLIVYTLLYSR